jgi:adenylate kinase
MILLMGIAGSGKGTQGKMLADRYGLHLISMGDVLRMYVTGAQRKRMLAGDLLDDDEIIAIVDKVLASITNKALIILDGFPRTIPQAEWLLKQVKRGRFGLDLAIHLRASHDAVRARLLDRGRIDDTAAAIEARFKEYTKSTVPLIDWLRQHGVQVVDVNAERSVETVQKELVNYLDKIAQTS